MTEVTPEIKSEIENAEVGKVSETDAGRVKTEGTRSTIAQVYVIGFLLTIGVSILLCFGNGLTVEDTTGLLVTISGILSGPLGFIIGYYYKATKE